MISKQQAESLREEATWWADEAASDRAQSRDDTYARGQAAGLRRALRMLGADDGA